MKKLISIFLAVIMIITSCICGSTVFAANCNGQHSVASWSKNNKVNHIGTCLICNQTVKMAHDLVADEDDVIPPTCTETGYTVYHCSAFGCDYTETSDTTFATGHDVIKRHYNYDPNGDGVIDAKDDMYMQNGLGQWISGSDGVDDYVITTYCNNKYISSGIEKQCITSEYRSRGNSNICKKCYGYTLLEKTVVEATCSENGYTEYVCSIPECGKYTDDFTPKADHNFVVSEVVEPTCPSAVSDGKGYTVMACTYEGCTATEKVNELNALEHDFSSGVSTYIYYPSTNSCVISGTCTRCGVDTSVTLSNTAAEECDNCGAGIKSKVVTISEGCTEAGKAVINCNCGIYEIVLLPTGHVVDKTTYTYANGKCVEVIDDCVRCGVRTTTNAAAIEETLYGSSTSCIRCTSPIQKRVITEPTCNRVGFTKVTCPECGTYTEDTATKLSHSSTIAEWTFNHDLGTMTFSATCKNPHGCGGYTYDGTIGTAAICSTCRRNSLTYKKTVHPTCTTDGYTYEECSVCAAPTTTVLKATGKHDFVSKIYNPTCENKGYTLNTCKDCYYTTKTGIVAALGHSSRNERVDYKYYSTGTMKVTSGYCTICNRSYATAETAIEPGENKCSNCQYSKLLYKETSAPQCNNAEDSTQLIDGKTITYCSYCYKEQIVDYVKAEHSFGSWETLRNATCAQRDEDGNIIVDSEGKNPSDGLRQRKCSTCGYVEENIIKANEKHSYLVHTPGKNATCTTPGYETIRRCTICGILEGSAIDADGNIVAKTIPATGHMLSPGTKNENFCVYCNSYLVTLYDKEGNAVAKTDENGNPLYHVVDNKGEYVYTTDGNNNKIPLYTSKPDANDVPIYELTACDCMHHNADGLAKFVVDILMFFCKLLRINQVCGCGELHFE